MPSHPPFRLRLTLAFLVLALAGVALGASILLGSGQEDPASASGTELAVTGPPLVPTVQEMNPSAFEAQDPGMRLGVLDKEAAIREERQNRRDARALRALAAQQQAILDYAAAVDAAAAAAAEPSGPAAGGPSTPAPDPGGSGGGGGTIPTPNHNGDPLYTKLDNIASCESNQNPRAVSADRQYWGAFQFAVETWRAYAGTQETGPQITQHSYNEQREVAARLANARGFSGSWPYCSAQYGYT